MLDLLVYDSDPGRIACFENSSINLAFRIHLTLDKIDTKGRHTSMSDLRETIVPWYHYWEEIPYFVVTTERAHFFNVSPERNHHTSMPLPRESTKLQGHYWERIPCFDVSTDRINHTLMPAMRAHCFDVSTERTHKRPWRQSERSWITSNEEDNVRWVIRHVTCQVMGPKQNGNDLKWPRDRSRGPQTTHFRSTRARASVENTANIQHQNCDKM